MVGAARRRTKLATRVLRCTNEATELESSPRRRAAISSQYPGSTRGSGQSPRRRKVSDIPSFSRSIDRVAPRRPAVERRVKTFAVLHECNWHELCSTRFEALWALVIPRRRLYIKCRTPPDRTAERRLRVGSKCNVGVKDFQEEVSRFGMPGAESEGPRTFRHFVSLSTGNDEHGHVA